MEILDKLEMLMRKPAMAFTVEELKFLILLDTNYPTVVRFGLDPEGHGKRIENIYDRLRGLPREAGGIEGGYLS